MRKVLLKGALLLAVAVTWVSAGLTTEAMATKWPKKPQTPISPELAAVIHQADGLAYDLDEAPCYWVRSHDELQEYREVQDKLKAQYAKAKIKDVRDYIDDVGTYLRESRDNFYDDELFGYCEWSYYWPYGKSPVSAIPSEYPTYKLQLRINGYAGQLKRPEFGSALQLENLGAIIAPRFGSVIRDDDYLAFGVNGAIPSRVGSVDRVIFGYHYGTATNHSFLGALSTGGADLNILSPQGPNGGLGGGVNVNGVGGFADVTNLRYADDYSEHLGYLGLKFNPWSFSATGLSITPFAKVIGGYDRESSNYSGTSANGGLDFAYSNHVDTWRAGGELGAYARQPLSDKFGLYGAGAVRFIYNYGSADSTLSVSGAANATESATASVNKSDVGFVGGGGVYARSGKATFSAGAEYETWEVPNLLYSQTAPFTLEYKPRDSITFRFGARIEF